MSRQNVEIFERGVDAFNRRDVEAFLEEGDEALEMHAALLATLEGEETVHRGHEGVREFFRDLAESFAELQIEIAETRDLGERVSAVGRLRGRGKESGAEVETPIGYVVRFEDGKVVRIDAILNPEEGFDAAGPSGAVGLTG